MRPMSAVDFERGLSKRPMWSRVRSWLSRTGAIVDFVVELLAADAEDEGGCAAVAGQAVGPAGEAPGLGGEGEGGVEAVAGDERGVLLVRRPTGRSSRPIRLAA